MVNASLSSREPPLPTQSRSIVRRRVSDAVFESVMLELFNGNLRSGERLDLAATASSLEVSHALVREAVVMLESDETRTTLR